MDCGTENVIIAAMQSYLRANKDDEFAGEKTHRYGSSPANRRIKLVDRLIQKHD